MRIRICYQEMTVRNAVRSRPAVEDALKHPRNRVHVIPCYGGVVGQEPVSRPTHSMAPADRCIQGVYRTSTMAITLSFAPCGLHESASNRSRWLRPASGGA
jgi:hypothetical protein